MSGAGSRGRDFRPRCGGHGAGRRAPDDLKKADREAENPAQRGLERISAPQSFVLGSWFVVRGFAASGPWRLWSVVTCPFSAAVLQSRRLTGLRTEQLKDSTHGQAKERTKDASKELRTTNQALRTKNYTWRHKWCRMYGSQCSRARLQPCRSWWPRL